MVANYWILVPLPVQQSMYPLQLSMATVRLPIPLPEKSVFMEVSNSSIELLQLLCVCFQCCTYTLPYYRYLCSNAHTDIVHMPPAVNVCIDPH